MGWRPVASLRGDSNWIYPRFRKAKASSLEERIEARLVAMRAKSGETVSELEFDAPAVFDGLIAAAARLYLTDRAGHVRCFAAELD